MKYAAEEALQMSYLEIQKAQNEMRETSTNLLEDGYFLLEGCRLGLGRMLHKISLYITCDTTRKERFADVEICNSEDNNMANMIIEAKLQQYTIKDCRNYLESEGVNWDEFTAQLTGLGKE